MERMESAPSRFFTLTAPSRGFRVTLRARPWGEPTASAQIAGRGLQGRVCWG